MAAKPQLPSLDDVKAQLQALKGRGDALVAKKDGLLREAATAEEQQNQAIKELKELGYDVEALDVTGILELGAKLTEGLTASLKDLETAVTSTERMLGVVNDTLDV
jgi:hypothetical protein